MQLIKIVIVDDEKRVRASLKSVLELHYPDAAVIAEADDVQQATDVIKLHKPDVVLLDIKMPGGTGFDVLKQLMPFTFKVIFITAYDEYAIQAFKFSALDYLLKPVIPQELVNTLEKARQQVNIENLAGQFNVFLNNTGSLACETKKIVLNCQDKLHIISVNDIIRCEADRNYTRFVLINKSTILVSGSLKKYDDMLGSSGFVRCHHSHLVNLSFISKLRKRDTGILIMKDSSEIPVSTRKYSEMVKYVNVFSKF